MVYSKCIRHYPRKRKAACSSSHRVVHTKLIRREPRQEGQQYGGLFPGSRSPPRPRHPSAFSSSFSPLLSCIHLDRFYNRFTNSPESRRYFFSSQTPSRLQRCTAHQPLSTPEELANSSFPGRATRVHEREGYTRDFLSLSLPLSGSSRRKRS